MYNNQNIINNLKTVQLSSSQFSLTLEGVTRCWLYWDLTWNSSSRNHLSFYVHAAKPPGRFTVLTLCYCWVFARLASVFNTFFSFLEPAAIKEDAGSPADSKQEVFWSWGIWSLSAFLNSSTVFFIFSCSCVLTAFHCICITFNNIFGRLFIIRQQEIPNKLRHSSAML